MPALSPGVYFSATLIDLYSYSSPLSAGAASGPGCYTVTLGNSTRNAAVASGGTATAPNAPLPGVNATLSVPSAFVLALFRIQVLGSDAGLAEARRVQAELSARPASAFSPLARQPVTRHGAPLASQERGGASSAAASSSPTTTKKSALSSVQSLLPLAWKETEALGDGFLAALGALLPLVPAEYAPSEFDRKALAAAASLLARSPSRDVLGAAAAQALDAIRNASEADGRAANGWVLGGGGGGSAASCGGKFLERAGAAFRQLFQPEAQEALVAVTAAPIAAAALQQGRFTPRQYSLTFANGTLPPGAPPTLHLIRWKYLVCTAPVRCALPLQMQQQQQQQQKPAAAASSSSSAAADLSR